MGLGVLGGEGLDCELGVDAQQQGRLLFGGASVVARWQGTLRW